MTVYFVKCGPIDTVCFKMIHNWKGSTPRAGDWVSVTPGHGCEVVKDVEWDVTKDPVQVKVWLK